MAAVHPTHDSKASDAWSVVRALTRARKDGTPYSREPHAEAQIRRLCTMAERERQVCCEIIDRNHPDFVGEEALVYCLRAYQAQGDADRAWQIAERLTERVAGHIRRKLARWRLTPDDADECARDLFAALYEAVFNREPAAEFWEVRFWVCLDRRLWNLIEKRQAAADQEWSGAEREDEARETQDSLLRIPDTRPGPEELLEQREALALLTENERLSLYLCRVEGWPEESDDPERPSAARALGVTGRTVRNYLRRAEAKLRAWEQEGKKD